MNCKRLIVMAVVVSCCCKQASGFIWKPTVSINRRNEQSISNSLSRSSFCNRISSINTRRIIHSGSIIEKKRKEDIKMIITPIKYGITFLAGITFSTMVNSWVKRRRDMESESPVSGKLFLDAANAHVRSASLKAAVELDVFTRLSAIARRGEPPTAAAVAIACGCDEGVTRGMVALLDSLVSHGFLTKGNFASRPDYTYRLTPSSAKYLDSASTSCLASAVGWLCDDAYAKPIWEGLAAAVLKGGATPIMGGVLASEAGQGAWKKHAEMMKGRAQSTATKVAAVLTARGGPGRSILDVGAGHGIYGLAMLRPRRGAPPVATSPAVVSSVTALDWPSVLRVATANAQAAGLERGRYTTLAGDARALDWGTDYSTIILANFLSLHGDNDAVTMLSKAKIALAKDGKCLIVEPLPDEDRRGGEATAGIIPLLALTPAGGTRTYTELALLCATAGFGYVELVPLPSSTHSVVIAYIDAPVIQESTAAGKEGSVTNVSVTPVPVPPAEAAKAIPRSEEEATWNYPMGLGDFFSIVERMISSSITTIPNPFEPRD